ncbi:sugar ABC transporter substrate-binding protein [Treponema primitia]|uniref:sugar ABC transporter substrate-binding protein n=1 Tax=Treponema primitia TaxID=88058 RepID=UPI00397F2916
MKSQKGRGLAGLCFIVCILFLTMLTGCSKKKSETLKFAIFIANNTNEFTMSVGNGAVKRGKELGIEVTLFDAKYDQGVQIAQIETCITQGYDALIIEPCSVDGAIPAIKEANSAKIPVVTIIQEIADQNLAVAFVGADHNAAAKVQMQACIDAIGQTGNIGLVNGVMGSTGQIIISDGYYEILAKYPGVTVLEEQSGNWVIEEALKVTETWLQKHNNFDAILGQSDALALGALKACEDAGIKGIYISGRDSVSDALYAIKEGRMNATIWQNGPVIGSSAVDVAQKAFKGEGVDKYYMMENIVVNLNNVDYYLNLKAELSK